MADYIFFDMEYINSQESTQNLISCSLKENDGPIESYWLYNGTGMADLHNRLKDFKGTLISFNATAEARSLYSLDLNPMNYDWIDLHVEMKALQNCGDEFSYGCYFDKFGNKKYSDPGFIDDKLKRVGQKDGNIIGTSLAATVARLLEVDLGKVYKSDTIDLILSRSRDGKLQGTPFSESDKARIMEYCDSDINYLPQLLNKMIEAGSRLWGLDLTTELLPAMKERAKFTVALADLERRGFPIRTDYLDNLSKNYKNIAEDCYTQMNNIYEVFEKTTKAPLAKGVKKNVKEFIENTIPDWPRTDKGNLKLDAATVGKYHKLLPKSYLKGVFESKWTKKVANIYKLIDSTGKSKGWPLTEKGSYATDDKTLKAYSHIPEIDTLRKVSKTLTQINWFRPKALPELFSKIGRDERLRTYFNPYGAQSARSQPPAKSYPFLWSSWLRCVVQPKKGNVMISADYGSQEFIVAAALSKDENMIEAYDSGDPYLYFAKLAGAVPWEGTKQEYSTERDMFKSVVLGLQYGLGVTKLSEKLTSDMGREVNRSETWGLIQKHKAAFPVFWQWADDINYHYFQMGKPLIMGYNMSDLYTDTSVGDLWPVNTDNPNALSIKNVPVQGVSASIMRRAVILCIENSVPMFATLHDGFYFECDAKDEKEVTADILKYMDQAAKEFIGHEIRVDIDVYKDSDLYVPSKGKEEFERFKKYIITED